MYSYKAEVMRWKDGDTVVLRIDLGLFVFKVATFRLVRIDTPKKGEPGYAEANAEAVRLAPAGSQVIANTQKQDRYGRWLADILIKRLLETEPVSVSTLLLASGHAVPYVDRATRTTVVDASNV